MAEIEPPKLKQGFQTHIRRSRPLSVLNRPIRNTQCLRRMRFSPYLSGESLKRMALRAQTCNAPAQWGLHTDRPVQA